MQLVNGEQLSNVTFLLALFAVVAVFGIVTVPLACIYASL